MLSVLLEAPNDEAGWQRFSWNNRTSHDQIRQAIQAKSGAILADLILDPITPEDWAGWLERHALTHQQMNLAAGQISADLSELDPRDPAAVAHWIEIHHLEHYAVEAALGIAS